MDPRPIDINLFYLKLYFIRQNNQERSDNVWKCCKISLKSGSVEGSSVFTLVLSQSITTIHVWNTSRCVLKKEEIKIVSSILKL